MLRLFLQRVRGFSDKISPYPVFNRCEIHKFTAPHTVQVRNLSTSLSFDETRIKPMPTNNTSSLPPPPSSSQSSASTSTTSEQRPSNVSASQMKALHSVMAAVPTEGTKAQAVSAEGLVWWFKLTSQPMTVDGLEKVGGWDQLSSLYSTACFQAGTRGGRAFRVKAVARVREIMSTVSVVGSKAEHERVESVMLWFQMTRTPITLEGLKSVGGWNGLHAQHFTKLSYSAEREEVGLTADVIPYARSVWVKYRRVGSNARIFENNKNGYMLRETNALLMAKGLRELKANPKIIFRKISNIVDWEERRLKVKNKAAVTAGASEGCVKQDLLMPAAPVSP